MSRRRLAVWAVSNGGAEPDASLHGLAALLHVDMDAFFASVELARRPELRGRPVIVGGQERSVVLAATYEARAYGVHSAMPMTRARRLCPQAVIVPPDHRRYVEVSRGVMDILRSVTPLVEQISIDEAFLDVAGARRRLGEPLEVADSIRTQVAREFLITCSVGIAATKSVAKIASTRAKPDGVLEVPAAATLDFLWPLPVGALWGVGGKTGEALARWGIATVGQLANTPPETLRRAVGAAAADHLQALSWGRDPRPILTEHEEKSVGAETTFAADVDDARVLREALLDLADRSVARLRQAGLVCQTVAIKVKTSDFVTMSRSRTLEIPTDVTAQVFQTARGLLVGLDRRSRPVRLLGIRLENVRPAGSTARQLTFDERDESLRIAADAVDSVRARFGQRSVRPATLIAQSGDPVKRSA